MALAAEDFLVRLDVLFAGVPSALDSCAEGPLVVFFAVVFLAGAFLADDLLADVFVAADFFAVVFFVAVLSAMALLSQLLAEHQSLDQRVLTGGRFVLTQPAGGA